MSPSKHQLVSDLIIYSFAWISSPKRMSYVQWDVNRLKGRSVNWLHFAIQV